MAHHSIKSANLKDNWANSTHILYSNQTNFTLMFETTKPSALTYIWILESVEWVSEINADIDAEHVSSMDYNQQPTIGMSYLLNDKQCILSITWPKHVVNMYLLGNCT